MDDGKVLVELERFADCLAGSDEMEVSILVQRQDEVRKYPLDRPVKVSSGFSLCPPLGSGM